MRKLIVLAAVLVASCSSGLSEADVTGTYVARYDGDKATLSIDADQTYRLVITPRDGKPIANTGTWRSAVVGDGVVAIEFTKFRLLPSFHDIDPKTRQRVEETDWVGEMGRSFFGTIEFCYGIGDYYCFVKQ